MAFEGLSEKLNGVFKRLKSRGKLSEADVKEAMREVKMALLEADVSYKVVKDFIAKVTERSVGEEVLKSLTPGQQVIKIVNDELIKLRMMFLLLNSKMYLLLTVEQVIQV
jgi:signal recognition particle subunit SRP54